MREPDPLSLPGVADTLAADAAAAAGDPLPARRRNPNLPGLPLPKIRRIQLGHQFQQNIASMRTSTNPSASPNENESSNESQSTTTTSTTRP